MEKKVGHISFAKHMLKQEIEQIKLPRKVCFTTSSIKYFYYKTLEHIATRENGHFFIEKWCDTYNNTAKEGFPTNGKSPAQMIGAFIASTLNKKT